jgi:hemerythrin superfamily protein
MKTHTIARDASADAISLLKADHREVEDLFRQFENASDSSEKVALASAICHALGVHAEIEEQIFYPESRRVLDEESQDIVDEAVVEHASLKNLMSDLADMRADDELFDARVKVLKEYVQHHVEEEESEYFPKVAKTRLDLRAVGARLQALKDQIIDDHPPEVTADTVSFAQLSSGAVSRKAPARSNGARLS